MGSAGPCRRASPTDDARVTPDPTEHADPGSWLPVAVSFNGFRADLLPRLQQGLEAAGQVTRIDILGTLGLPLTMLRVRCPHRGVEAPEQWLYTLIRPFDERGAQWASDIDCLLIQRWREFPVWRCTRDEERTLHARCVQDLDFPSPRAFVGCRYTITLDGDRVCRVSVFPRAAAEMLSRLPRVVMHGPADGGDPHAWVAIEEASGDDIEGLIELADCLQAHGITTRRYELPLPGSRHLLCVHDGGEGFDGLRARIRAATAAGAGDWRRASLYWPCMSVVLMYRCQPAEVEPLVKRIQHALPDVALEWSVDPKREASGLIYAQIDRVDDVQQLLREGG